MTRWTRSLAPLTLALLLAALLVGGFAPAAHAAPAHSARVAGGPAPSAANIPPGFKLVATIHAPTTVVRHRNESITAALALDSGGIACLVYDYFSYVPNGNWAFFQSIFTCNGGAVNVGTLENFKWYCNAWVHDGCYSWASFELESCRQVATTAFDCPLNGGVDQWHPPLNVWLNGAVQGCALFYGQEYFVCESGQLTAWAHS